MNGRGLGGRQCFSEKTKEPRTLSTEFPSLVTFNLNKVHAFGDAVNSALIFHVLFENKKGSECKSTSRERGNMLK